MFLKEIKYQQSKYFDCVSDYLDNNIFAEKNFYTELNKKCNNSALQEFYLPYFNKSTFNSRFFSLKFLEKLELAYLNLGRHGYNSHLCENFAYNFSDSELRTDVHFNKMTKTESPSNFLYGLNSNDPSSINRELERIKNVPAHRQKAAIANGNFPKSKEPLHFWIERMKKETEDHIIINEYIA